MEADSAARLQDGDGKLDEKELHICLLLLYDKLNDKLPCHVRVPTPEEVHTLFQTHATTNLSEDEFVTLAANLLSSDKHWWDSVFAKVALSVGLQLAIFPLAGVQLLRCTTFSSHIPPHSSACSSACSWSIPAPTTSSSCVHSGPGSVAVVFSTTRLRALPLATCMHLQLSPPAEVSRT